MTRQPNTPSRAWMAGPSGENPVRILARVPGQMYDPAVQRALLERLARWRQLPEGDLIGMLGPVDRLRYRQEALEDLEWEGLVVASPAGDERVIAITEEGDAWLRRSEEERTGA